ncbi:hypothetical protein Tco_0775891 [Tanacetum coccineum]
MRQSVHHLLECCFPQHLLVKLELLDQGVISCLGIMSELFCVEHAVAIASVQKKSGSLAALSIVRSASTRFLEILLVLHRFGWLFMVDFGVAEKLLSDGLFLQVRGHLFDSSGFGWSLGIGLDLQLFVWLFGVGLSMPRKLVHKGKNPPFTD